MQFFFGLFFKWHSSSFLPTLSTTGYSATYNLLLRPCPTVFVISFPFRPTALTTIYILRIHTHNKIYHFYQTACWIFSIGQKPAPDTITIFLPSLYVGLSDLVHSFFYNFPIICTFLLFPWRPFNLSSILPNNKNSLLLLSATSIKK